MFCPKCGNQLVERAQFCNNCGFELAGSAPQQPRQAVSPAMRLSKKEYISKLSSPKVKRAALTTWITFGLSLLFLVLGLNNGINAELEDVPFWSVLAEIADGDLDELEEEVEYEIESAEYIVEMADYYDYDDDDIEALEKSMDKVSDKLSAANLLAFYQSVYDLEESNNLEETIVIMQIVIAAVWVMFFLPLLFALLGGLLRNMGLTIACLILMIPAQLVFGNVVFLLLTLAALSVQIAMLSTINKEYKKYRVFGIVGDPS